MNYTIAIDGPVGAGKSSVADEVASALGILHLDTGAMYRAFALYLLKQQISLESEETVSEVAGRIMPDIRFENGCQRTLINGEDVTDLIRTPEVSMAASCVSRYSAVRKAMVKRQREMAQMQSMLLDGRDIGTVVLPNATLKIYLTATAGERARRRWEQQKSVGNDTPYEQVLQDVIARDEQDMNRKVDPLRVAADAQIVDSTSLDQEQTVCEILRRLDMKLGRKPSAAEPFNLMEKTVIHLSNIVFRTLLPVTVHNVEQLQMDAPYILISNHNHLLDPIMISWKCYRYHPRFIGKKELVSSRIGSWFFNQLEMISVDRHNSDMAAMRAALNVLKEGKPLGVFPEGTRHKEGVMEDIETGTALLALKSKCDLLPVYFTGAPRLFHRIHMYVGQPIHIVEYLEHGMNVEACNVLLGKIRSVYRDFVEQYGSEKVTSQKM